MCSSVVMLCWLRVSGVEAFFYCQGMSETRSVLDVQVPVELQWIYKGPLKGDVSLLNVYKLKYVHEGDFT